MEEILTTMQELIATIKLCTFGFCLTWVAVTLVNGVINLITRKK